MRSCLSRVLRRVSLRRQIKTDFADQHDGANQKVQQCNWHASRSYTIFCDGDSQIEEFKASGDLLFQCLCVLETSS